MGCIVNKHLSNTTSNLRFPTQPNPTQPQKQKLRPFSPPHKKMHFLNSAENFTSESFLGLPNKVPIKAGSKEFVLRFQGDVPLFRDATYCIRWHETHMFRPHWFQAQNPSFVAVTWRGVTPKKYQIHTFHWWKLLRTAVSLCLMTHAISGSVKQEKQPHPQWSILILGFFVVKNLITYTYAINHHSCQTNQVDVLHAAYCWLEDFANISKNSQQNCIRLLW